MLKPKEGAIMLTGELAEQLEELGLKLVIVITKDGRQLNNTTVGVIMSTDPIWDSIIEARETGPVKSAAQTARELSKLDQTGIAQICYYPIDGDKFEYYNIDCISIDDEIHIVTIHPGDFRCG
jgi:hypothetical protein